MANIDRADFSNPEFNPCKWLENQLNNAENDKSSNNSNNRTINQLSQIVLKLGVFSNDCDSNLSSLSQQLINATKRCSGQFEDLQRDVLTVRKSINQSINQFYTIDQNHHSVVNVLSVIDTVKHRHEETDRLIRMIDDNRKKEKTINQTIETDDVHRMAALVQSIKQSANQSDQSTVNDSINDLIVPDQVLIDRLVARLKELSESKIKQSLIDRDLAVLAEYEDVVQLIDRLIDIGQLYIQSRETEIDELINRSIKQANNDQDKIINTFDRLTDWLIEELIWCERAFPHPNQSIVGLIDRLIKKAHKPFSEIMLKYVTKQPTSQVINPPAHSNVQPSSLNNQTTNQPIKPTIDQCIEFSRTINKSINRFAARLIQLIDRFVTQPQGDEILYLMKQSVTLLPSQLLRLYTSSINQLINSFDLGSNQSIELSNNVSSHLISLSSVYQTTIDDCLIDCSMNAAPELCELIDQSINQYYTRINQSTNRVRDYSIKQTVNQPISQSINQCDDDQLNGFFNLLSITCTCLFDAPQTKLINQSITIIKPAVDHARANPLIEIIDNIDQPIDLPADQSTNQDLNIRILSSMLKHDQTRLNRLTDYNNQCSNNQSSIQLNEPSDQVIKQLFPMSSAGHKKLIDCLVDCINQYLFSPLSKKLSNIKSWPGYKQSINQSINQSVEVKADGSEDQITLPSFSAQPSESIILIGEYLLSVLQQIDQSINQSIGQTNKQLNNSEQSSINQSISFDQDYDTSFFMSRLSVNICMSFIQSIKSLRAINSSLKQSLLADLEYLCNVLTAMTIEVPQDVDIVKHALNANSQTSKQYIIQLNDKQRTLYEDLAKLVT